MKRKIILIFAILIFLSIESGSVLALEIKYPTIPGKEALGPGATIESYVAYIYNFFIIIGGLIAFGAMIYGGVEWLVSAGSPGRISEARKRILGGFLGLIILLSSYLILYTINPNLTFITFKKEPPKPLITPETLAGVYFCKEFCSASRPPTEAEFKCIDENCSRVSTGYIPKEYRGENLKSIQIFIPQGYPHYYIIFYEEPPIHGTPKKCGVILPSPGTAGAGWYDPWGLSQKEAKYVIIGDFPGYESEKGWVKFCENVLCEKSEIKKEGGGEEIGKEWGPYSPANGKVEKFIWSKLNGGVITPVRTMIMKGKFNVILFKDTNFSGECYTTLGTDYKLGVHFTAGKGGEKESPYAQIGSMILIPQ